MKVQLAKTTQTTKPKRTQKPYAPQTPDSNRPDLGRPATRVAKSKKRGKSSKAK